VYDWGVFGVIESNVKFIEIFVKNMLATLKPFPTFFYSFIQFT
jgi:hypothetical protein